MSAFVHFPDLNVVSKLRRIDFCRVDFLVADLVVRIESHSSRYYAVAVTVLSAVVDIQK